MSTTHLRQTHVEHTPSERNDLTVDGDTQSDVLRTLSSETAQAILGTLGDEPKPVSEIAEAVGTSMQNAQYHIERLLEANLVEPVDVWYSAKGREMSVYALTAEELLVQFGGD
ncbi:MAG: ArsR/SmtB family transcription factor [Halobacteriales archaeon]